MMFKKDVLLPPVVRENPLLIVLGIVVILTVVLLSLPIPQEQIYLAPQNEADRFYFGGSRVLGQALVPPPGLAEIIIPIGFATEMKGPFILHVRESWYGEDLRTSTVYTAATEDVKFKFPMIVNPPPHVVWLLEAPHGTDKAYWVYREKDETGKSGNAYLNERKIVGGFGYTLVKRRPLAAMWLGQHVVEGYWHPSQVMSWEKNSLLVGVLGSGALLLFRRRLKYSTWPETRVVLLLIGLGIFLHVPLALHMPLVNDEGAYIQDVLQAKPGFLPLREYLAKGPLYLIILKAWQLIMPHTVLYWRLLPAISWALAAAVFWQLLRQLAAPPPVRLLAVAMLTLLPAAVSLTTPLLLQTTSTPVLIASLLAVTYGARRHSRRWVQLGALLLTMAFFVRVSSLVGGFVGVLLLLMLAKRKANMILWYVGTGLITFLAIMGILIVLLGWQRALVAINAEAIIISEQRAEVLTQRNDREPLIRELTIESRLLWRGGAPLLAGLFLLPLAFITRRRVAVSTAIVIAWVTVLYQVYWHLADTDYLLPGNFSMVEVLLLCVAFGSVLLMLALRFTGQQATGLTKAIWHSLMPFALWLVLLAYLYLQWGRFRQSYLVEFIPPLAVLSAWGLVSLGKNIQQITPLFLRRGITGISLFVVIALYAMGWHMSWQYPHTGTISQASLHEFTEAVRQHVPPGQEIFTAQPNVTAFSKRPIIFGNSHPGWYREARLHTIPDALRALFFVSPDEVTQYLRHEAQYVVMEVRTNEIYFDGYPERLKILTEQFTLVVSVPNSAGGGTFELFERKQ